MNKKLHIFLPVVISIFMISSCKKEENKSRSQLLQDNTCWNATKFEAKNPESGLFEDYTDLLLGDACYKDNCYTFGANGIYTENEGPTKCNPTDENILADGTWNLSADESSISITEKGETRTGKIEILTANKFVFVAQEKSLGDVEVRVTYE